MRRPALLLLAGLLAGAALPAHPQHFTVQPGSRFWIDGSATTGPYTCEADEVSGAGRVEEAAQGAPQVTAEVAVPVRAFDCGMAPMNRDFYAALRGDAHPAVRFTLERAEVVEAARPGAWARVRATGALQLAGTTRRVVLAAEGQQLPDGRVRVRGEQALRMSDFGIEPPTGLLGLVRAHDGVTVRFDLVAAAH
jgi:polyisoprenoid-binding protein YceI